MLRLFYLSNGYAARFSPRYAHLPEYCVFIPGVRLYAAIPGVLPVVRACFHQQDNISAQSRLEQRDPGGRCAAD